MVSNLTEVILFLEYNGIELDNPDIESVALIIQEWKGLPRKIFTLEEAREIVSNFVETTIIDNERAVDELILQDPDIRNHWESCKLSLF